MPGVSDNIKFQVLHAHYDDTFANIKESIRLRDKLTLLTLLVLGLVVLCTIWPTSALDAMSQAVSHKYGVVFDLNVSLVTTFLWFALLGVIVRYTQVVIYIERQYAYIHKVEGVLAKYYDDMVSFTREGKSYLEQYPTYSNWTCFLYTNVFPLIVAVIILMKIGYEWMHLYDVSIFAIVLDTLVALSIIVTLVLYKLFMHKQEEAE